MLTRGPAKRVTIYVNGDTRHHLTPLHDAVMTFLMHKGVSGATATRAYSGFGGHQTLHTPKIEVLAEHLPIRIEFVDTVSGVEYFNDSKATNVDATLKALDAFAGNVLVILGGKDKVIDFTLLRDALARHARLALLIGDAAGKIETQLAGVVPAERAGTLARAVEIAAERAQPGDTVLLAPACASFDQFENYEQRGRVFKQLVRELAQKNAATSAARKV